MRYIDTYDIFNGSNITGLTRAFDNANTNPRLSRFPVINNWHFWLNVRAWAGRCHACLGCAVHTGGGMSCISLGFACRGGGVHDIWLGLV